MTFSANVKDDLARIQTQKPCCQKATLAAYLGLNANIEYHNLSCILRTEHASCARKLFSLAKELKLKTELITRRKARLKKNQVFYLKIFCEDISPDLAAELGLNPGAENLTNAIHFLSNECCQRAYLRGAFMAAGYISNPESSYHLELALTDMRRSLLMQKILNDLQVMAKITRRKDLSIIYIKGAEQISLFLNIIGAHRSLLEFESVRVDKDVRNQVNRLVNCDNANMNKTVSAAQKQIAYINFLENKGAKLSTALQETAHLRLQHPDASLADLSEMTALGRSAINHRLRRLEEIAIKLGFEQE